MALRKIITIGDEMLLKVSREVEPADEKTIEIIKDLWDTCKAYEGAGLAAVQVGLLRRVAVVTDGEQEIVLINPKIVKSKGCKEGTEGCLSVPEVSGYVERPESIIVETYDTKGNKKRYKAKDLLARAICHEMDHMDGILFTTKMREIKEE